MACAPSQGYLKQFNKIEYVNKNVNNNNNLNNNSINNSTNIDKNQRQLSLSVYNPSNKDGNGGASCDSYQDLWIRKWVD